jgi:hypothetical protein
VNVQIVLFDGLFEHERRGTVWRPAAVSAAG